VIYFRDKGELIGRRSNGSGDSFAALDTTLARARPGRPVSKLRRRSVPLTGARSFPAG
jgi:hypothetical protein